MKIVTKSRGVTEIDHVKTGKLARDLRKKNGVSVATIAKKVKISAALLYMLERGIRSWDAERFEKVVAAITALKK